jgi:hypothetical protein
MVNPNPAALDSKPPFQRIYRRFQPDETKGAIKFSTTFVGTSADAFRLCGERLAQYQRERHGPTMVIGMGGALGFDPRQWRRAIPVLHEYPMCVAPPIDTLTRPLSSPYLAPI